MKKLQYLLSILILIDLLELVQSPGIFCFPLCGGVSQCDDVTYAGCKGASCNTNTHFVKPGGAPATYYCTKKTYHYFSGDVKWEPAGLSPDIPLAAYGALYGANSNITASALTIGPDTQDECVDGANTYTYYNLSGPDVLIIIQPAFSTNMNFYQIRIIYEVITFE